MGSGGASCMSVGAGAELDTYAIMPTMPTAAATVAAINAERERFGGTTGPSSSSTTSVLVSGRVEPAGGVPLSRASSHVGRWSSANLSRASGVRAWVLALGSDVVVLIKRSDYTPLARSLPSSATVRCVFRLGAIVVAAWLAMLVGCGDGEAESAPSLGDWMSPTKRPHAPRTASPPEAPAATTHELSRISHQMGPDGVRVTLSLDGAVPFETTRYDAEGSLPARLSLRFPRTALAPSAGDASSIAVGEGGLTRLRVTPSGDALAVTFDLSEGAFARWSFVGSPFRVFVDVSTIALPARAAALEPTGPHPLRVIVLDPGHGGDDHGARRPDGLRESNVALDIARRVKRMLRERLAGTTVLLTRDDDTFVSLEQRAAYANVARADAFVSIHLNASPVEAERGGVTTFVLDTSSDRQARKLAALENGTTEHEVGELEALIASAERQEQLRHSRALAERIHVGTLASGRREYPTLHDRGIDSALFYVLVGATMPAVLVEASFILRGPEAEMLSRESYREALARGIAEGIVRYSAGDVRP